MWEWGGGIVLLSPTVWAGSGEEQRDTNRNTQERARECCTYPLATYPSKSARMICTKARGSQGIFRGSVMPFSVAHFLPIPLFHLCRVSPQNVEHFFQRLLSIVVFFRGWSASMQEEGTKTPANVKCLVLGPLLWLINCALFPS